MKLVAFIVYPAFLDVAKSLILVYIIIRRLLMAKLTFIYNKARQVLDEGIAYLGIDSPFKSKPFKLTEIIYGCSYQLIRKIDNGDGDRLHEVTCEECIRNQTNYRVAYKYIDGDFKIRARCRFQVGKNFKIIEN